jgi:hypothetical protein
MPGSAGQSFCPAFSVKVLSTPVCDSYVDAVKTVAFHPESEPTAANSFRLLLEAELERRCARNGSYSLRTFAKYLGVDHSTLSQWLRGKRRLTPRSIERLGRKLGLTREAINVYVARERHHGAAGIRTRVSHASNRIGPALSWHDCALLELTRLRAFRPNSVWISSMLDISVDEVNIALARLARLGLLEMTEHDRWVDKTGSLTANIAELSPEALQKLTEQLRSLLLAAIRFVPGGCCDHRSTTLAVRTERLPAIIDRINQFERELIAELDQDDLRDDVYQIELSLFPITTLKRHEEPDHGTAGDAVADPRQGSRETR